MATPHAYDVAVFDGVNWVSIRGEPGPPGTGIKIKGTLPSVGDLPAIGSEGDTWLIAGHLHVWDVGTSSWTDVGNIQGPQGLPGAKGDVGPRGNDGVSSTIQIGTTTTSPSGTNPTVKNVGTASAAVLDFSLPLGASGPVGPAGPAATVSVGNVTDLPAGTPATVSNTGSTSAAIFNFGIPAGQPGAQGAAGPAGAPGAPGAAGADGKSATIAVGTVTAGAAGSTPSVVNSGTQVNATFDFTIPAGAAGAQGAAGTPGAAATISIGTVSSGTSPSVTNSGNSTAAVLNFVLQPGPQGPKGDKGADGSGVTIKGRLDGGAFPPAGTHADGDMYIIGSPVPTGAPAGTTTGHGVVYSGGTWTDVGPIEGPVGPAGPAGPAGPSAVSADLNNEARLGSDSLIFVPRPTIPAASTTSPSALGTAAPGSLTTYARADHVHSMPTAADVGAANAAHTHAASAITGLSSVAISGDYADLTNKPAPTSLSIASASTLGGVKIGSGISVTADGTISATTGSTVVDASTTTKGIVRLAAASDLTGSGSASAVPTAAQLVSALSLKAPITSPEFLGNATIPNGTALSPALTFSGDNATGLFLAGSENLAISSNGTQVGIFGSSGLTVSGLKVGGYAFPASNGTSGQHLSTNGAGVLSWADPAKILPANATFLGSVKIGGGVDVTSDGTISVSSATASVHGLVKLADAAAVAAGTAGSVIDAAQLKSAGDAFLRLSGGTMTDDIYWDTGAAIGDNGTANTFSIATSGLSRLQVDSSGHVRLLKSDAQLHIGNAGSVQSQSSGVLGFLSGSTLAMTVEPSKVNGYKPFSGTVPDSGGAFVAPNPAASTSRTAGYGFQSNVNVQAGETRYQVYCGGTAPSLFNAAIYVSAGTAAAASIATSTSPGTGLFFPAADTLAITTHGAERLRVGPDGTLGIGINSTSKNQLCRVNVPIGGASSAFGWRITSQVKAEVTSDAYVYQSSPSVESTATTARFVHFRADVSGTMAAGVALQVGFWAANTIKGAKQNFGFRSDVVFGAGNYGFYESGGADNYFKGNVGFGGRVEDVGSNAPKTAIDCYGSITISAGNATVPAFGFRSNSAGIFLPATDTLAITTGGSERLRVTGAGNITAATGYTPTDGQDLVTKSYTDARAATASFGTPANSTAPGPTGTFLFDNSYIYIRTASEWKKAPMYPLSGAGTAAPLPPPGHDAGLLWISTVVDAPSPMKQSTGFGAANGLFFCNGFYSVDGITWNQMTIGGPTAGSYGPLERGSTVSFGNGLYVASNGYSYDGQGWTTMRNSSFSPSPFFFGGKHYSSLGYYVFDGDEWVNNPNQNGLVNSAAASGQAVVNAASTIVVGISGTSTSGAGAPDLSTTGFGSAWWSADPDSGVWAKCTSGGADLPAKCHGVAYSPTLDKIVVISSDKAFVHTGNGVFTAHSLPTTGTWAGLCWTGNEFLTIQRYKGANVCLRSTDGQTWTQSTLGGVTNPGLLWIAGTNGRAAGGGWDWSNIPTPGALKATFLSTGNIASSKAARIMDITSAAYAALAVKDPDTLYIVH